MHHYTSDLSDPFAYILSAPTLPPDLGTKMGEGPTLPLISLTADDFVTHQSRGPFLLSVTEPAAVAAVSLMPLADGISLRTRSRLVAASSGIHASHFRTPLSTPSVSQSREITAFICKANVIATANSSQATSTDTDAAVVFGKGKLYWT